jgi:HK97 family phage portal protein
MAGPEQRWPPSQILPPPSESQALSVPAFWRGMAIVCGGIGMLPRTAYRGTDAVDPQPAVIRQPDPNQSAMAFWSGCVQSLALYGNSVCIVTSRDKLGYPLTLKPIHPTLAAVRFTGNPMAPTVAMWYVAGQLYDPDDIWHIKSHLGRAGWPLGRGLIDEEGDAIAMALALQSYGASYFNAGGMPTGILKVHRPEVTQEQAEGAKSAWVSKYAGVPSVAVLNELTDFTPVSFRPVDSQMIESRQFSLIEVALMWGIPPSKLGANVGGGTYKNAQMEELQNRNDSMAPWIALLEEAASNELLPRGQHLSWDMTAFLQTDTLSQYQAYNLALGGPGPASAWMLQDEVRARESLDPMADVAQELGVNVPGPASGETAAEPDTPPAQPPVPPLVPSAFPNEPSGEEAVAATNGAKGP